jgi:cell wall-associated NlpC family hydrolase
LQPGDLVFFDTGGRGVSHVGVVVSGDRFAHASTSRGVMYSRLGEEYWTRRYLGARRP